jgi:hypothetical protein
MIFLLCVDFFTWNTSPSSAIKIKFIQLLLFVIWLSYNTASTAEAVALIKEIKRLG